jgi:hypothetical protein
VRYVRRACGAWVACGQQGWLRQQGLLRKQGGPAAAGEGFARSECCARGEGLQPAWMASPAWVAGEGIACGIGPCPMRRGLGVRGARGLSRAWKAFGQQGWLCQHGLQGEGIGGGIGLCPMRTALGVRGVGGRSFHRGSPDATGGAGVAGARLGFLPSAATRRVRSGSGGGNDTFSDTGRVRSARGCATSGGRAGHGWPLARRDGFARRDCYASREGLRPRGRAFACSECCARGEGLQPGMAAWVASGQQGVQGKALLVASGFGR